MFLQLLVNILLHFKLASPGVLLLPLVLASFAGILFISRKSSSRFIHILLSAAGLTVMVPAIIFLERGFREPFTKTFSWFISGQNVPVSTGLDQVSSLMLVLVLFITALVVIYSVSYMKGDRSYGRYFSSLLLFASSMTGIIISENLLLTFVFWELVGFSSYLLINHWYNQDGTSDAARKAFIVNRIADTGFVAGLGLFYAATGTFEVREIIHVLGSDQPDSDLVFWAGLGVVTGCLGKSAQFPFFVWLPDAMKAPTPVSALLHAATMVAAGIFLLGKIFALLHPDVLTLLAFTGALTSLTGAFAAATQTDIKKILAYSTISQLGYMMTAIGTHAYAAAMLHLFTHAVFKATLFLCAGAVIHAMAHLKEHTTSGYNADFDPQDIRLMGGLRKRMPVMFLAFALAVLAGGGVPLTAGFLSKDEILAGAASWAFSQSNHLYLILPVVLFCTSFATAFYLGRMFFVVFFGGFRLEKIYPELKGYARLLHEPDFKMLFAIVPLALMCLFIFFSFDPFDPDNSWVIKLLNRPASVFKEIKLMDERILQYEHTLHYPVISVSVVMLSLGFASSYFLYAYKTKIRKNFTSISGERSLAGMISFNALYLDNFYRRFFVRGVEYLAVRADQADRKVIDSAIDTFGIFAVVSAGITAWFDKYIVDGLVHIFILSLNYLSGQLRHLQNGKVQTYIAGGVIIIVLAVIWLLL